MSAAARSSRRRQRERDEEHVYSLSLDDNLVAGALEAMQLGNDADRTCRRTCARLLKPVIVTMLIEAVQLAEEPPLTLTDLARIRRNLG